MTPPERTDGLDEKAREFADDLNRRLSGVLPDVPSMSVLATRDRVAIFAASPGGSAAKPGTIPLRIAGTQRLNLRISMECTWDGSAQYLTLESSKFAVETLGEGTRAQPLFRYEYDRASRPEVPSAHLHVHAHRDELTWMMVLGERGRAKSRNAKGSMPILSELHFPLGGHPSAPVLKMCWKW